MSRDDCILHTVNIFPPLLACYQPILDSKLELIVKLRRAEIIERPRQSLTISQTLRSLQKVALVTIKTSQITDRPERE